MLVASGYIYLIDLLFLQRGYSEMDTDAGRDNLARYNATPKTGTMKIDATAFVNYLRAPTLSQSTDFKWKKTELASMETATAYLRVVLKNAGMPDILDVFDVSSKNSLLNVLESDFPIQMAGGSDFIITTKMLAKDGTHPLELHENLFLVIELNKYKVVNDKSSLPSKENQAFSLLMGIDCIQKQRNRFPVVLTDLKEFIFCWIGKENQRKVVFYWSTENVREAALLMTALAIEEAQKAGIDVTVPQLPAALNGLPIFNRCKLQDPATIIVPDVAPMSIESSSVASGTSTAPTSTGSQRPMGRGRRRNSHRDDDDDFDDRLLMARQVYLKNLRYFDTWSENPTFSRPLSTQAADMYV